MVVTFQPPPQGLVLHNISWQTYESILRDLEGQHFRITYDRGSLEIMTVSFEHEHYRELLSHFVRLLTLELAISMCSGGSLTFKKRSLERGLEPDKCWWIEHAASMRGKKTFDVDRDAPPDLAIEVEISRSALDRMDIYASLRVPEVWCYDGETLRIHHLTSNGKYRERAHSKAFPFLPMEKLGEFLTKSDRAEETALLRAFVQWIRDEIVPIYTAKPTKKNGKRSTT